MTNKEAIQWLEPVIKMYSGKGYYDTNRREALNLAIKALKERPHGEFTIDELERWLYQIAFNNTDNDFSKYCEEIIGRLDGFERFVTDVRKEAENER